MIRRIRSAFLFPASFAFLFAFPASTNYQLEGYGFGGGGEDNMTSSNYAIDGLSGEVSEDQLQGTNYDLGAGLAFEIMANVPPAPTFTNPSNYYNKLHIVLDTGSNPSDTTFSIAISTDDFVTTNYIQSDDTVGATLGIEDYQTYTAWGGASGFDVVGLSPSTTYKIKVKAMQGKYSESGYGPTATAATVGAQLTFDIDVSAIDEDNSVTAIDLGNLTAGSVVSSTEKIWVDFSTNGASGGKVYVGAANAGLYSSTVSYTISSASGNLTALSSGFGAQGSTATQSSGGPFSIVSPYDGSSNTVGVTDTTIREIFSSSNPISGGRASFLLKAKSSAVTPAAGDYTETLTVIASGSF